MPTAQPAPLKSHREPVCGAYAPGWPRHVRAAAGSPLRVPRVSAPPRFPLRKPLDVLVAHYPGVAAVRCRPPVPRADTSPPVGRLLQRLLRVAMAAPRSNRWTAASDAARPLTCYVGWCAGSWSSQGRSGASGRRRWHGTQRRRRMSANGIPSPPHGIPCHAIFPASRSRFPTEGFRRFSVSPAHGRSAFDPRAGLASIPNAPSPDPGIHRGRSLPVCHPSSRRTRPPPPDAGRRAHNQEVQMHVSGPVRRAAWLCRLMRRRRSNAALAAILLLPR